MLVTVLLLVLVYNL